MTSKSYSKNLKENYVILILTYDMLFDDFEMNHRLEFSERFSILGI